MGVYWRTVQQKAAWRILVFVCVFTLFLSVNFVDLVQVVTQWADASSDHYLVIEAIRDLVVLLSIAIWRKWCLTLDWRVLFSLGPVFAILSSLFALCLCSAGRGARSVFLPNRHFAGIRGRRHESATLVPVTEIVQEGSEASTVGFVLSF